MPKVEVWASTELRRHAKLRRKGGTYPLYTRSASVCSEVSAMLVGDEWHVRILCGSIKGGAQIKYEQTKQARKGGRGRNRYNTKQMDKPIVLEQFERSQIKGACTHRQSS